MDKPSSVGTWASPKQTPNWLHHPGPPFTIKCWGFSTAVWVRFEWANPPLLGLGRAQNKHRTGFITHGPPSTLQCWGFITASWVRFEWASPPLLGLGRAQNKHRTKFVLSWPLHCLGLGRVGFRRRVGTSFVCICLPSLSHAGTTARRRRGQRGWGHTPRGRGMPNQHSCVSHVCYAIATSTHR